MFLPELYSGRQNNNSLEGTPRIIEKHDCSQTKYPSRIGQTYEGARSSFGYSIPSSSCECQSQHALIDDDIDEGDSDPSANAHPLNTVNVISNLLSVHHESSCGKIEKNGVELNPAAYLRNQTEPSDLNLHEGSNKVFDIKDSMRAKSYSITPVNKKGKRKPRIEEAAAHIPAGKKAHADFQVKMTTRDMKGSRISRPSGRKDRHSKVLTSKGPRDRRIRLSVGTAIKLYCLQDRLGFDQPSKAVEWLIDKSLVGIRELPQLSSISCRDLSKCVDSNRAAVSVSCHKKGDLSSGSGDCLAKPYKQILAANACLGQKSSAATTTESSTRGQKRGERSKAMSSVSSGIRATANGVRQKEFRAKARERARERTKQKGRRYNQHSGPYNGILQSSSVPAQSPKFCLQGNTTSASYLNIINESMDANSNGRDEFLYSLMFPNPSILCSPSSLCISFPPAQIQCSSLASVHYSSTQQEGISIHSTEASSGLHPKVFPLTSYPFPQAVATTNNCTSHCQFGRYPLDSGHQISSNLFGSCREHSIQMPDTSDDELDTSYGTPSAQNREIFQELQVNAEIPGTLKSSKEYVPSRIILTGPSAGTGIFGPQQ